MPLMPEAEWRGPLPSSNYAPGNRIVVGMTVHHMDGSWQSAEGRFTSYGAGASACFGVRYDGSIIQWVDTSDFDYHACQAQWEGYVGVENESDPNNVDAPLTDAQVAANARIGNWLGIPAIVIQNRGEHGVGYHRLFGGECSGAWGQTDCPGSGIANESVPAIVQAMKGADPVPNPTLPKGDDVVYQENRADGSKGYWVRGTGGLVQISNGEAYAHKLAGVPFVEYPTLGIIGFSLRLKAQLKAALV
jgi:hypothetical protein